MVWAWIGICTGQGRFSVLFCSIRVLIYAALFVLAGVSVLVHKCVVQKRMRCWDRGRISLLNIVGMPGANSVLRCPCGWCNSCGLLVAPGCVLFDIVPE